MEILSNEEKKDLFMKMVERKKCGTLDTMKIMQSKVYKEEYNKLKNNHGPFGLVISEITKNGNVSVYLTESLEKQNPSDMAGSNYSSKEFTDEELKEFMDKFFEMNNMEILNEFYKTETSTGKNVSFQEYKNKEDGKNFDKLVTLNALDYLEYQNRGKEKNSYYFENGLVITPFEKDEKSFLSIKNGNDFVNFDIKNGVITEKYIEDSKTEQYLKTFLKSVEDLPRVYKNVVSSTYNKDEFIPNKNSLKQKEIKLSSLEMEAKKISKEELINKENSRENQNVIGD